MADLRDGYNRLRVERDALAAEVERLTRERDSLREAGIRVTMYRFGLSRASATQMLRGELAALIDAERASSSIQDGGGVGVVTGPRCNTRVEWSVVTAHGLRDRCRDEAHARAELERWSEYVRAEFRHVTTTGWGSAP